MKSSINMIPFHLQDLLYNPMWFYFVWKYVIKNLKDVLFYFVCSAYKQTIK